jgi:hypothetical protein
MSDLAERFRRQRVEPPVSRVPARCRWRSIAALVLLGPTCALSALANTTAGDKLLVVDCLLPAQVRQLGSGFTYLAPRQAIKTSGSDCELRGGEYVASDRAGGAAALRVWLPQATQGDKIAQTYVGEIFEKGLGAQPDYQGAATWYRKAADQGYSRAMINLGFLYEKGLGVEKDPVAALNWYRKASGLSEAIRLDGDVPASREAELKELRNELERARQQLDRARKDLERERARSSSELERLRTEQKTASAAGDLSATQRLQAALLEKEAAAKRRDSEFAELERVANLRREQLEASEREGSRLKSKLDDSERAAATARDELARRQQTADAKGGAGAGAKRRCVRVGCGTRQGRGSRACAART